MYGALMHLLVHYPLATSHTMLAPEKTKIMTRVPKADVPKLTVQTYSSMSFVCGYGGCQPELSCSHSYLLQVSSKVGVEAASHQMTNANLQLLSK